MLSYRINHIVTLIRLAELGLQKAILEQRYITDHKNLILSHWTAGKDKARSGDGWVKEDKGRLIADRLYKLFINLYGPSKLTRELTAEMLLNLYECYSALHPGDNISVTRIYHFFPAICSKRLLPIPNCNCCGNPFIIHHRDGALVCGRCMLIENSRRKRKAIISEPPKTLQKKIG